MWMPLTRPLLGTWPATQAYALTGNQTSNPLVLRLALNPLSHTSQGCYVSILLLQQITINLVAYNNTDLSFYNFIGQKFHMGLTGLKSRCGQAVFHLSL